MKRWLDDPAEPAAKLLAPLASPPTDPDARARTWRALERRTVAATGRSFRLGALLAVAIIAGAAAGKLLLDRPSPPAPPERWIGRTVHPERSASTASAQSKDPVPGPVPGGAPFAQSAARAIASAQSKGPDGAPSPGGAPFAQSAARAIASAQSKDTPITPAPTPTPDAELAAYRQARISMRADLAAGLAALRAFLASYPTSRFDAEARLSVIECQVRLGHLAAAAPDVSDFLVRFPDSERAAEVRFVRAEIERQVHGRCATALADYRAAAASPRVGDDARFFLGWCADALGDRAERDRALTAYLAAAPTGRHAAAATALLQKP